MRRLFHAAAEFVARRGEHFLPVIFNGGVWVGLGAFTPAGLTIDKWIEMRTLALSNHVEFRLDWLDWSKAVCGVALASLLAYRNFTDGSLARYRDSKKQSETEFLRRQAANGNPQT